LFAGCPWLPFSRDPEYVALHKALVAYDIGGRARMVAEH
jgi:hypothetical protein